MNILSMIHTEAKNFIHAVQCSAEWKIKRVVLASALILTCLAGMASAGYEDEHLWRHRLVVLAAPTASDPAVQQQLQILQNRSDALNDRDIRVYQLYQTDGSQYQGQPLDDNQAVRLRDRLGIRPDSRLMILVGKDGTVKRRAPLDSDLRELLLLIDEMPMRRREIQDKIESGQKVTPP